MQVEIITRDSPSTTYGLWRHAMVNSVTVKEALESFRVGADRAPTHLILDSQGFFEYLEPFSDEEWGAERVYFQNGSEKVLVRSDDVLPPGLGIVIAMGKYPSEG
jgi:hypothetical protein